MASAVPYDLLTPREVAEVMRVSTMTVYRLIKSGQLPAIRVGKHLRIRGNDVVEFLDARVVYAPVAIGQGRRTMARRLIGLDIGTNAVRVVELEPAGELTRVTSFGQVALPPDAMREGEVVDAAAVTAAIQRLWKELSLRKGEVRVGVASPRVLVRTVDLPVMSESDLAGALRFQAQELIPIPIDDAVLDFQVLEQLPEGEPGRRRHPAPADAADPRSPPPTATRSTNLVGAVRGAGLTVAAVDLVPLAPIRSIGRRVSRTVPAPRRS